jgi:hypothetical protein
LTRIPSLMTSVTMMIFQPLLNQLILPDSSNACVKIIVLWSTGEFSFRDNTARQCCFGTESYRSGFHECCLGKLTIWAKMWVRIPVIDHVVEVVEALLKNQRNRLGYRFGSSCWHHRLFTWDTFCGQTMWPQGAKVLREQPCDTYRSPVEFTVATTEGHVTYLA